MFLQKQRNVQDKVMIERTDSKECFECIVTKVQDALLGSCPGNEKLEYQLEMLNGSVDLSSQLFKQDQLFDLR